LSANLLPLGQDKAVAMQPSAKCVPPVQDEVQAALTRLATQVPVECVPSWEQAKEVPDAALTPVATQVPVECVPFLEQAREVPEAASAVTTAPCAALEAVSSNEVVNVVSTQTTPAKRAAIDTDTPEKICLKRTRLHGKTSWIPEKPPRMSVDLIRQVQDAAQQVLASRQGNPAGRLHSLTTFCAVCKRQKRACAWETRANGTGTVITGSQCASCTKACRYLGVSRFNSALSTVPAALDLIRAWGDFFSEMKRSRGQDLYQCSRPSCVKKRQ